MASIVYILCGITSITCWYLLVKGYRATRSRLLFWCSFGFAGLALNNIYLYLDMKVFTDIYMAHFRPLPGLIGLVIMLYGLIKEEV